MRVTVVLLAALVANATLAGCLMDDGGAGASESGSPSPDDLPVPPVAALMVMIDGNMTEPENGSIATRAGVNLTFDASGSSGANVSFAWDMGDGTTFGVIPENGAEEPAANTTGNTTGGNETLVPRAAVAAPGFQPNQTNATSNETMPTMDDNSVVVYAYLEAGNYTVTLYVTDDAGQTDTSTAELAVGPGGPAPGTFIRTDTLTFSQAATNALTACVSQTKDWVFVGEEAENGTMVEVQNVTIKLDGSGTNVNGRSGVYFLGPDGKEIKSSTTGFNDKTLDVPGPLAAGKYQVKAEVCQVAVQASYTLTAVATYVAK
ncbi:MAG: PKD domain-containing protein [Euryarchaeota archaeon]|nr:PKD domain-containing protein [Euryarchaeota archaeon]